MRVGGVDDDDVVTTGHRGPRGQKYVRAPKRGGEMLGA